jgi:hypothetical protein
MHVLLCCAELKNIRESCAMFTELSYFRVSKTSDNKSGCSQCCIPQTCKLSVRNNKYFRIQKMTEVSI